MGSDRFIFVLFSPKSRTLGQGNENREDPAIKDVYGEQKTYEGKQELLIYVFKS